MFRDHPEAAARFNCNFMKNFNFLHGKTFEWVASKREWEREEKNLLNWKWKWSTFRTFLVYFFFYCIQFLLVHSTQELINLTLSYLLPLAVIFFSRSVNNIKRSNGIKFFEQIQFVLAVVRDLLVSVLWLAWDWERICIKVCSKWLSRMKELLGTRRKFKLSFYLV